MVTIGYDSPLAIAAFPWWKALAEEFLGRDAAGEVNPKGACEHAYEDNLFTLDPTKDYRGLTCDATGLLIKPGICKFVKGQEQCVEWEEFACYCLTQPIPQPEPEPQPEPVTPDSDDDASDDETGEDNK